MRTRTLRSWNDLTTKMSVFVSFGSEYFMSKEEIEEIAHGLQLSKVNFRWVVRFPMGEKVELEEALPKGFIERVGERRSCGALGSTGKNSGPFKHWWLCESLCM
ncbi:hypothetical protein CsSME_00002084 [Camellia sinensis var. sinensis]